MYQNAQTFFKIDSGKSKRNNKPRTFATNHSINNKKYTQNYTENYTENYQHNYKNNINKQNFSHPTLVNNFVEKFDINTTTLNTPTVNNTVTVQSNVIPENITELTKIANSENIIQEKKDNEDIYYLRDPYVWGPLLWFSLHNGAAKYPDSPTTHVKEKTKGFILGIPYILPCHECSEHAQLYIDKRKEDLDEIVSSKDAFFKFTYDLHNDVNKRIGNDRISLDEAKKIYYDDL